MSDASHLIQEFAALREKWGILLPATVELSARKATGGHVTYPNYKHMNSYKIVVSSHMTPDEQIQTLRHEAAHAFCHQKYGVYEGHSARFWTVAERMGVTRRCAPLTEEMKRKRAERKKSIYKCPNCAKELVFLRALKATLNHYHKSCGAFDKKIPLLKVA